MRVFLLEAPGRAVIRDIELRDLKPDEVLIKVRYAGICGTDLSFYTGNSDFVRTGQVKYPVRIGHEWSGVVERVGPAVRAFRQGDRVFGDNGVSCGVCGPCAEGDWAGCTSPYSVGTLNCWDGSFADYIIMPQRHTYHLDDRLSLLDASLIEPASISFKALKREKVAGKSVLVIGTGPIALSAIPLAKKMGAARVILQGRTRAKLDIGEAMGADAIICSREEDPLEALKRAAPEGVDLVLEASGAVENIWLGVHATRRYGSVALLAFYETGFGGMAIDRFIGKEVSLYGVMGGYGLPAETAELMAETGVDLTPMVTATIGFDELPEAFANAGKMPGKVKIMVDMEK